MGSAHWGCCAAAKRWASVQDDACRLAGQWVQPPFRGDDGSKRHILFQSGLMLDFALKGRDEAAKAALAEFAAACKARNGSAARQAIGKLEEALAAALQKLVAYEQELAR